MAASGARTAADAVIGFLGSRSPAEFANVVAAFRRGLHEAGFVEGQNCLSAFRWAEGRLRPEPHSPALATELVGLRVAVLFTAGAGTLGKPRRRRFRSSSRRWLQ